jgi:hypothetical protein
MIFDILFSEALAAYSYHLLYLLAIFCSNETRFSCWNINAIIAKYYKKCGIILRERVFVDSNINHYWQ